AWATRRKDGDEIAVLVFQPDCKLGVGPSPIKVPVVFVCEGMCLRQRDTDAPQVPGNCRRLGWPILLSLFIGNRLNRIEHRCERRPGCYNFTWRRGRIVSQSL